LGGTPAPDAGENGKRASSSDLGGRMDLAAAGLLTVQSLRSGQRIFPTPNAVKAGEGLRNGQWIAAKPGIAGGEVMLDRRARPRPAAAPRLEAGAIENTARNWLDGALGLHSKVQTTQYEARPSLRKSIDWGRKLKDLVGRETK
jgi:hypothetical protein